MRVVDDVEPVIDVDEVEAADLLEHGGGGEEKSDRQRDVKFSLRLACRHSADSLSVR